MSLDVRNNPAGRLHDLLEMARQRPPQELARNTWAAVFGVDPNTGVLLKMLADLFGLINQAKAAIQQLDDVNHALYLKPLHRIETILSHINLEESWDHWKRQINEAILEGLQFNADLLSRKSGFTHVNENEISGLKKELEALMSLVIEVELPNDLKFLFIRNLEAIHYALLAYRVRGIEGLEQEIERAVGSMVLHKNSIPPNTEVSPRRKAWENFCAFIGRLNNIVSLAKNSKELGAPVAQEIIQRLGS